MNKKIKCTGLKGIYRFICKGRKKVCNKRTQEIARKIVGVVPIFNPVYTPIVPIVESSLAVASEVAC